MSTIFTTKIITFEGEAAHLVDAVELNAKDKDIDIEEECCCGCTSNIFLNLEQLETIVSELKTHIKEYEESQ